MSHDVIAGPVIMSPLILQLLIAVVLTALLSFVLIRLDVYRWLWSRPLVELAMFCLILGVVVALAPDGWPAWPASAPGAAP